MVVATADLHRISVLLPRIDIPSEWRHGDGRDRTVLLSLDLLSVSTEPLRQSAAFARECLTGGVRPIQRFRLYGGITLN